MELSISSNLRHLFMIMCQCLCQLETHSDFPLEERRKSERKFRDRKLVTK